MLLPYTHAKQFEIPLCAQKTSHNRNFVDTTASIDRSINRHSSITIMPAAVQEEPPVSASKKKQQAATKAVAFWVGFYVVWAHCLVVWKWMTPPEPAASQQYYTATSHQNHGTANNPVNGTTADHEISEQLQRILEELEVAIADARESNVVLQEQVAELGEWTSQVEQIIITMAKHVPHQPSSSTSHHLEMSNVRKLLQLSDLSALNESSDEAAQYLVARAIHELEQWLVELPARTANANEEDDPWNTVASFFSTNDFPPRRPLTRRSSMACANSMAATQDGDDHPIRRQPTQFDLEQAEAIVQESFLAQKDALGLPVSFAETVERRRQALLNAAAAAASTMSASTNRSQAPHHHNDNDDTACLQSIRDVLPWLQAGLEAVYKKQDVRQALLEALEADGIDTSRILLDADLKNHKDPATLPPSSTINLRQVLDQPTLHEWSVVVDRFLDWVSGRNDSLDELLDQWVYAHVPSETDDDRVVGRKLVSLLLREAGRVEIPAALLQQRHKR